MFKAIKKQLKIVLTLIPGYNYIRLKKNGKLVIKKFSLSIRAHRFELFNFLLERVPDVFETAKIHKYYMSNMEKFASDNNVKKALELVHEVIESNKFKSHVKLDNYDLKEIINEKISRVRNWIKDKRTLIKKHHPEITIVRTVKSSVSKALTIGEAGIVGIISTGNADFDAQFRTICRYNNLAV